MKPSSVDSHEQITQLGTIAQACLAPGQRGKVLAAFSKAIYLLADTYEIFWIATADAPLHRRCAQVSSPLPRLLAGSPFHVESHRLTIDPAFAFDLQGASVWSAPGVDPNHVLEITVLSAHIQCFFSNLDFSKAKGFGSLIPYILRILQSTATLPVMESADPILRSAQPLVLDMAHACLKHQASGISRNSDALIGMGAGLTPSGDDFLGGLWFALNRLQAAYPDLDFAKYAIPVEPYRRRTHLIGFTLLKDFANGHAIAPLHHIINDLLGGESPESRGPFVSQLTQVGHSTGWDLLAGLLVGLLTVCQGNHSVSSCQ